MLIISNCVRSYLSVPLPLVTLEVQVGQEHLSRCYIHWGQLCSHVIAHTQHMHPTQTRKDTPISLLKHL